MSQAHTQPEDRIESLALRALTLEERLRFPSSSGKTGGTPAESFPTHLKTRRSWFDRGDAISGAWRRFLSENDLSEAKLLRLANLTRAKKLPSWVETLHRLRHYLQNVIVDLDERKSLSENMAASVVGFAWDEFVASPALSDLQLLSSNARLSLQQSLLRRLAWTAKQAANWEISAARAARNPAIGSAPRDTSKFRKYFFSSGVSIETLKLLENFPVLARLWAIQVRFWLRFVRDFLQHADAFARDLGLSRTAHLVISTLEADLSDPHHGNRAVLRVEFSTAGEWLYKPRPGLQERAWFELLRWINSRGFARPFRILAVQCEDRHCWMESVSARLYRNRKEAADFYFRLGALMCLIHGLRGVDFHSANIIVAGDQPVIVDCETLLHPATSLPAYARREENSILRTGMLSLVKDISTVTLDRQWESERLFENLIGGFRVMHDFLRRDRLALPHVKKWTTQLGEIAGRNVYRPTMHYYKMLEGSLAPSLLTKGLDRSLYLHACCRDDCNSRRRVRAEVQALENTDIPVFRSRRRRMDLDLSEETLAQSIAKMRAAFESAARTSSEV